MYVQRAVEVGEGFARGGHARVRPIGLRENPRSSIRGCSRMSSWTRGIYPSGDRAGLLGGDAAGVHAGQASRPEWR